VQAEPEPVLPMPADPDPPAPDAPVIAADVPAEPAPAAPSHARVEAAYMAALRENINARTAVPDSAEYRLLKPHGEALVRFFLDRSGMPGQVALQRTSGSHILDAQALHIVSSGRYPPFPESAFPGEAGHSFAVHVEFY
jgi:protein TonB